jgi:Cu(I)/Ag(I) efflux system membrane fusion protein
MFADGKLTSRIPGGKALLIPRSAVLWTGKRSVVYVKVPGRKNPTFLYREIMLGPNAGDYYVVESGLSAGEEIATHGVFKIDAAAQLSGKPSMMNSEGEKVSTGHNHGGMQMDDNDPAMKQ